VSSIHELSPGMILGAYRVGEVVGRGGMGIVYAAEHVKLGRRVALKILAPALAEEVNFRARFVRESRLVAALDHPNVVPVYDAGEENGFLYIAMRFVDGESLHALVEREGGLAPARAVWMVREIASALDAAHARGLVHRDVKPPNILLDRGPDGERAFLSDFGVAWHRFARDATAAGTFVGTADWSAPEQIEGKSVDERTDVYALGAVLFFALAGRPPFEAESDVGLLYAHLTNAPPLVSTFAPAAPPALDDVVERALAKSPSERFQSAGELGEAARAALAGVYAPAPAPVTSPPPPPGLGPPPGLRPPPEPMARPEPVAPPPPSVAPGPRSQPPPPPPVVAERSVKGPASSPPATIPPAPVAAPAPPAGTPEAVVKLRLREDFQYVHEPLEGDDRAIPFLGNRVAVEALKDRIRHSSGGSFLVTGFRGVGKTTIIRRALNELRREADVESEVLRVSLNIARPVTTDAMLFEVVRRLFEELTDQRVLASLRPDVQRALIVAYTRTSLSFKETRSSANERARSLGINLEALPMLGRLGPALDFSRKRTDSMATEAAFLAYSDADVEHDFLRIVSLLHRVLEPGDETRSLGGRVRARLRLGRPAAPGWDGRLVVVIDELDKLTATDEGIEALERILTGLKNLLTTRGVHFLFVAGPDLHGMALRESQRGSSVYESVFGWQLYIPCVWHAADELLEAIVVPEDRDDEWLGRNEWYEELRDYLAFKARGIPRLLLLELNSFVRWLDGRPVIALDAVDVRRVEFYAALQRILRDFVDRGESGTPFAIAIDEDRWRLGAYYVVDWILRCRDRSFTVDELLGSPQETPLDPSLVLSPARVRELLDHLVAREVLEQVRGRADQTFLADTPEANSAAFRVVDGVYEKLVRFQRWSERERAELAPPSDGGKAAPAADGQPWADTGAITVVGDGRYELRREIGRSSVGGVYRAYDRTLAREVAVKMLDLPGVLHDDTSRSRFLRAVGVATTLDHPNLVPTLDTFAEDEGRLGIVMELVDGTSLATLVSWGPLPGAEAVRISVQLLDALAYLAGRGLARFDLKPSSILLDEDRVPLISDVALARVVDEQAGATARRLTQTGIMVGTPRYAAPEQIRGEPVDIRADICALGLILYEMLAGRPARDDEHTMTMLRRIVEEDVDVDALPASPELRAVVARSVARKPDDRYPDPVAMREAVLATPEAAKAVAVEPPSVQRAP